MSTAEIRKKITPILKTYGIKRAGLFGSAARGEEKDTSDIDILVEIEKDISLLEFIKIKRLLEQELKKKVDLVEYEALKPSLREKILGQQIELLWRKNFGSI